MTDIKDVSDVNDVKVSIDVEKAHAEVVNEMTLYNECLSTLKQRLVEGQLEVNAQNIMLILKITMEIIEFTQLKGTKQRSLAVRLIRQVVIEAPISDDKEKLLLDMIDNGIVDNTIDLVVSATHGELNVNAAQGIAYNCFTRLLKKLLDVLIERSNRANKQ